MRDRDSRTEKDLERLRDEEKQTKAEKDTKRHID